VFGLYNRQISEVMRILISAGEASGETYGAMLLEALRRRVPEIECFGVGGERMRAAGCDTVVHARNVAVVGLAEVVSHLPRIYGEFRKLLREVDRPTTPARAKPAHAGGPDGRPDVAVLIDFPDWNFRLARELHRRGVPVVYYVSPQMWAWRPRRIELVKKYVRKMLVIFPFEEPWYRERGVEAEYVGHPLADLAEATPAAPSGPVVALLPGSRRQEFAMNIGAMLAAAQRLERSFCEFVLPVANTLDLAWVRSVLSRETRSHPLEIRLVSNARAALAMSRAAVVASGTATLEAALIGTPFVMVYRVSRLTWLLGRRLVNVPFFAMPNLIAGREVVPELVQDKFTAEQVAARLREIMADGPARARMLEDFAEIRRKLASPGPGTASDRAAEAILRAARL
jgi:lipid-A-disaccharide synthase